MPSFCPKCRRVLEEDEICCAQLRYTWKCVRCHKLTAGFALPYGRCFLCGGDVVVVEGRDLGDSMRFHAIREAVQLELNAYHFYRLACQRSANRQNTLIFEQLFQHEVDHLKELEMKYHAHLDPAVIDLKPDADLLIGDWLFEGIDFSDRSSAEQIYEMALEMERRTRDHFRDLAAGLPEGLEKEICLELAAEEEEHVALLETELENFRERPRFRAQA